MAIEKLTANASLRQVMDKFEEISFLDFLNIDIIVRKELPPIVKNNQIVVLEDINTRKIILDTTDLNIKNNDIYVRLLNHEDILALKNISSNSKYEIYYYIDSIYKKKSDELILCKDVYKGIENKWVKVLDSKLDIFKDGLFLNGLGLINGYTLKGSCSYIITNSDDNKSPNSLKMSFTTTAFNSNACLNSNVSIDVTKYNKLFFTIDAIVTTSRTSEPSLYFGLNKESNKATDTMTAYKSKTLSEFYADGYKGEIEVDISNLSGSHYIQVGLGGNGHISYGVDVYISSIRLTD